MIAASLDTDKEFTEDTLQIVDQKDPSSPSLPSWEYIRVEGLGFFPGLICPHHDKIQSNGVPRCEDLNSMLLRHPGNDIVNNDKV